MTDKTPNFDNELADFFKHLARMASDAGMSYEEFLEKNDKEIRRALKNAKKSIEELSQADRRKYSRSNFRKYFGGFL